MNISANTPPANHVFNGWTSTIAGVIANVNAENTTVSGKFLSKVYEGPYKDTKKWSDDFEKYAGKQGFEIKKWFMWYTTCPKCAKKYGKNYVVIIAEVE